MRKISRGFTKLISPLRIRGNERYLETSRKSHSLTRQRRSALRHKSFLQRRRRQEGFVADYFVPLVLLQISRQKEGRQKRRGISRHADSDRGKEGRCLGSSSSVFAFRALPCLLINGGSGAFHLSWAEQRSRSVLKEAGRTSASPRQNHLYNTCNATLLPRCYKSTYRVTM